MATRILFICCVMLTELCVSGKNFGFSNFPQIQQESDDDTSTTNSEKTFNFGSLNPIPAKDNSTVNTTDGNNTFKFGNSFNPVPQEGKPLDNTGNPFSFGGGSNSNPPPVNPDFDDSNTTDTGKLLKVGGGNFNLPKGDLPGGIGSQNPSSNEAEDGNKPDDAVTDCHTNMCDRFDPCIGQGKKCAMKPDCSYIDCVDVVFHDPMNTTEPNKTKAVPEELLNTPLRPIEERRCQNSSILICEHGSCDPDRPVCNCDDKWTGQMCTYPCWLSCNHGNCKVQTRKSAHKMTLDDLSCNCEYGWTGITCGERIPNPKDEAEKAKALIASLTVALTLALVILVVLPVLLWRMRVIFIMKVVYMFKDYEDDDGKLFDAYVSMSPTAEAEQFVYNSLGPQLEDRGFKLYLPARDQQVGEIMSDSILTAVEQSRRTIMIVNPDYVENEWNRFEFLIAQQETLKLKQRIIPVILQHPCEESIKEEKSLKHILESVKCLKYPQELRHMTCCCLNNQSEVNNDHDDSKQQKTLENKQSKFWKRLELTMPKKRCTYDKNSKFFERFKIFKKSGKADFSGSEMTISSVDHSLKKEKSQNDSKYPQVLEYKKMYTNDSFKKENKSIDSNLNILLDSINPKAAELDNFPIEKQNEYLSKNGVVDDAYVDIQL